MRAVALGVGSETISRSDAGGSCLM